ncbi:MAG: hypothetical protein H6667_04255 [Ardenticatenaceae bacterium]|nr:hypothetical protein [Ardenticatenaceae bacterium]
MNDDRSPHYQAYLLRLWRETADLPWRATLENPHTGQRHGFADLSHLIAFFQQLDDFLNSEEMEND